MVAVNSYAGYEAGLADPALGGENVVFAQSPQEDVDLTKVSRAIRCGGAGTLVVVTVDGSEIEFTVAAGDIIPVRAAVVKGASTATNIVALW